uniref:Uncharacterized protein n=1 Tax=Anguilla anguilla TaxID=7936 RepID=A0A0E9TC23_ANGAN
MHAHCIRYIPIFASLLHIESRIKINNNIQCIKRINVYCVIDDWYIFKDSEGNGRAFVRWTNEAGR